MILRTHIPRFPLNQFIDHFIYYEGYNPEHRIDRFLPDGNTEIIIDFSGGPQYIYDNETLKEIQACHNVWASGVRTEYISIPSGKQAAMFVISFRKGMAYPFFPLPMNEMSDRVVDAGLLWGNHFASLREQLFEINQIDLKFQMEEILRMVSSASTPPATIQLKLRFAVSDLMRPEMVKLLLDKVTFSDVSSDSIHQPKPAVA